MKFVPIVIYLLVALVFILLPSSEGYGAFVWKLLVAQVFAIPSFALAFWLTKKYKK